jgi:guanylate kinase
MPASAERLLIFTSGPTCDFPLPRLRARGTRNARAVRRHLGRARREIYSTLMCARFTMSA